MNLTLCCSDRTRWLAEARLASCVRDEILHLHEGQDRVFAYCLMPDHLHLVLATGGQPLGQIVQRFKGRSSRALRKLRGGLTPWQHGYHDRVVRRSDGLLASVEYVLLNPVRAGLVSSWWEYPWLGAPALGTVGPDLFSSAPAEDILWAELLGDQSGV